MKIKLGTLRKLIKETMASDIDTSGFIRRAHHLEGPRSKVQSVDGSHWSVYVYITSSNVPMVAFEGWDDMDLGGGEPLSTFRASPTVEVAMSTEYTNEGDEDWYEFDSAAVLAALNV